jgi:hypothetical protein
MSTQIDDKGKFFTEIIAKNPCPSIIQTLTHRIQGIIYVKHDERLIEELNRSLFIAVTQAIVFNTQGTALYHSDFLTINREHIVWIIPICEIKQNTPVTTGDN